MKLDDIKLGMKVIVVKDRTEEGWVPLLPDIANLPLCHRFLSMLAAST